MDESSRHPNGVRFAKLNEAEVAWKERRSPGGMYHLHQQDFSIHMGGVKDTGEWGGGHPFDVALVRVPSGAMNFPRQK